MKVIIDHTCRKYVLWGLDNMCGRRTNLDWRIHRLSHFRIIDRHYLRYGYAPDRNYVFYRQPTNHINISLGFVQYV